MQHMRFLLHQPVIDITLIAARLADHFIMVILSIGNGHGNLLLFGQRLIKKPGNSRGAPALLQLPDLVSDGSCSPFRVLRFIAAGIRFR